MRVAGSIAGSDVSVLDEAVEAKGLPHRIELSEVEFVDAEGTLALLRLEALGTRLVAPAPYIGLLLRSGSGGNRP